MAERNPQRIALNYAEELSLAEGSETFTLALTDGISYADHLQLSKELGTEYAGRLVSAEYMILDYLNTSVVAEIVVYGGSGRPREIRELDSIIPGATTLNDAGAGWFVTREADHVEEEMMDFPLQPGDAFQIGQIPYYLLREGETEPRPSTREAGTMWFACEKFWRKTSCPDEPAMRRSRYSFVSWKTQATRTLIGTVSTPL